MKTLPTVLIFVKDTVIVSLNTGIYIGFKYSYLTFLSDECNHVWNHRGSNARSLFSWYSDNSCELKGKPDYFCIP